MPDILVRNLPAELHERLKISAANHRRSINQEAIQLLEKALIPSTKLLPPLKPTRPITMEETLQWIDEGQR